VYGEEARKRKRRTTGIRTYFLSEKEIRGLNSKESAAVESWEEAGWRQNKEKSDGDDILVWIRREGREGKTVSTKSGPGCY